ncbi:platelet glycoprotein IX-like [Oculina patagonica]
MGGRRFVYVLLLLGLTIVFVNGEKSAPPGCRVLELGKKLQCRGAGLSKIPKIPQGILIADFTDNQITHIAQDDLEHLEKLQEVYLKGNPFHCDCNLKWLRLKLHNSPAVIQDGDSIQCATPLKFQNKALKFLSNLCGKFPRCKKPARYLI